MTSHTHRKCTRYWIDVKATISGGRVMSAQFGKCNFDGKPVGAKDLDQVRPVLAPYGPDEEGYLCSENFAVLYRAFHTTKEARQEHQPRILPSGEVLTWDGRLDNRNDLIQQLAGEH